MNIESTPITKQKVEVAPNMEIAETPKVSFDRERGHELMSILFYLTQDKYQEWVENDILVTREMTEDYYKKQGCPEQEACELVASQTYSDEQIAYIQHLKEHSTGNPIADVTEVRAFLEHPLVAQDIVGYEEIYNLALTYGLPKEHPRVRTVYDMAREYKPWLFAQDEQNPEKPLDELRDKLGVVLSAVEEYLPEELKSELDTLTSENIKTITVEKENLEQDFQRLFKFFRPLAESFNERKINMGLSNLLKQDY